MTSSRKFSRPQSWPWWLQLVVVLVAFGLLAYGPGLSAPFIGDDYVFLDEVRGKSFLQLFDRAHTAFGWYRPWSREVHFWSLRAVSGLEPAGFRLASLALWWGALGFLAASFRRWAGLRVALIATLGLAFCSFWGAPLLWISGAQDLWMLFFVALALFAWTHGRPWLSLTAYGLALLSKETAAVLPAVLIGHDLLVARLGPTRTLRRALPFALLSVGWFFAHPTLLKRIHDTTHFTEGTGPALPWWTALLRSALELINADRPLNAFDWTAFDLFRTAASTAVVVMAWRIWAKHDCEHETASFARGDLLRLAMLWLVIGWLPMLAPSVGWQAYYGCLGACGAWLALGLLLESRPHLVLPVFIALGLLRGASAGTRSWDWGSEWYQRRAGNLLAVIHRDLKASKPSLAPYSRVFFGSIPNNIGLIAGQSPAVRVWYDDPTLEAGFYSYFRKRLESAPAGKDYFFHFDSTVGLVEVQLDPDEDVEAGLQKDPNFEANHESVAVTLFRGHDFERAALEFEKLSRLPWRADALVFAAVTWERAERLERADMLLRKAMARTGGTEAQITAWADRVREASQKDLPD